MESQVADKNDFIEIVEVMKSMISMKVAVVETSEPQGCVHHWSVLHWHWSHRPGHRSALHRHSRNRTWRQSAAHSRPGHRITVHARLRRSSRGDENASYHAAKENEFSPVHSVIGFHRLKPRGFQSCGLLEKIKRNDRVTNAPALAATN
jgi:hypothetical protein